MSELERPDDTGTTTEHHAARADGAEPPRRLTSHPTPSRHRAEPESERGHRRRARTRRMPLRRPTARRRAQEAAPPRFARRPRPQEARGRARTRVKAQTQARTRTATRRGPGRRRGRPDATSAARRGLDRRGGRPRPHRRDIGDEAGRTPGSPTRNGEGRPRIGDSRPAPRRRRCRGADSRGRNRPPGGRGRRRGRRRRRTEEAAAPPRWPRSQPRERAARQRQRQRQRAAARVRPTRRDPGRCPQAGATSTPAPGQRRRRRRHRVLDSLDEETLERRRGTHRKGRPAGRYLMVVHQRDDGIAHIAVLEGRTLVEHYVSIPTDDTTSIDGNIYLGRVQNVLPGMEAAFIDIGTPKNGVLYRGDVVYDPCRRRRRCSGRASSACCATASRSSCRSRRTRSGTRAPASRRK